MLATLDPPRDQLVTSSDLVRHFGRWQDRAARDPVYIMHRGRPRFVLTSVDLMEALCAPHASGEGERPLLDALLDGVAEMIVLADADGRVTAASRSARGYFGALVDPGAAAGAIAAGAARAILSNAILRVAASGVADRIDIPSFARAGRELTLSIAPCPGGVALFTSDATIEGELRAAHADAAATAEAFGVNPGTAAARINLRGYIESPGPDLMALTGLTGEALTSVRFAMLLDISARVAVTDAIESVITNGTPRALTASILVNRAPPLPVRIGLAARRTALVVDGVTALLFAASAG